MSDLSTKPQNRFKVWYDEKTGRWDADTNATPDRLHEMLGWVEQVKLDMLTAMRARAEAAARNRAAAAVQAARRIDGRKPS